MGHDDKGNHVEYDALLKDATTWAQESNRLRSLSSRIQAEQMDVEDFGLAAPLYLPYHQLVEKLAALLKQGADAGQHIEDSLRGAVIKYQAADQASAANINTTSQQFEPPRF